MAWPAAAGPLQAQGPIEVLEQSHEYTFADRLVFRLQARSSSDIVRTRVHFRFGSYETRNSDFPERFQPAPQIDVEVVRHLQRGLIAPAQEIIYWWEIEDAEGHKLETDPRSFLYLDERFDWQQLSEADVSVFYYNQSEAFATQVLQASRAALDRLAREVGVTIEFPIKVVVYNSREDMQRALVFRGETFEGQIITLGSVVAKDIVLLLGSDPGLEVTIFHELTHVVLEQATDNPFVDMPAWLNEGLASYNEGEVRQGYRSAVERACAANTLMSVRSITSSTVGPGNVTLFYAQSLSLVEYLLQEHGREKMLELLEAIKEGNLIDDALQAVYGFDQDGLEARWREWRGCPPAPGAPPAQAEPTATPTAEAPVQRPAPTEAPPPGPAQADEAAALRRTVTLIAVLASAGALLILGLMAAVVIVRRD